jgi:hypothetical protein
MILTARRIPLSRAGLRATSNLLGVAVARVRAVLKVEAAGSGYDKQGRVLILFEPHVFWRCLPAGLRGEAQQRGLAYPKWGTRKYPADSYPVLLKAITIHPEAAFKACSYGLPQILGENHKLVGYATAQAMFEAFRDKGEDEHVAAMGRFIKANPQMLAALQRGDMAGFAARYNGPGYRKNEYDTRLIKAEASYLADPWRGLALDPSQPSPAASSAPAGKTQADRARVAQQQAATAAGAAPAATVGSVAATPKTQAPWYVTYAPAIGIGLGFSIIAVLLIRKALRSRPTERAPVIERGPTIPILQAGA